MDATDSISNRKRGRDDITVNDEDVSDSGQPKSKRYEMIFSFITFL